MVEPRWTDLAAGDEFAGYRIESRLGRGGMGILYLAMEPGLERRVALKLIAPEAAAEEVFARRFAEESRIAASIEHPNVVPIYAAGEADGVPWIAMRYVPGSDLGRWITREGRLDPTQAVALVAQVGNGLDAIHAAGLVHRDVKPANVLLSGDPGSEHAYITDFGVARNVATQSGLTQTGRFVGTLDYVAPEQISGEPIDARADVYALGCLLFKLLTGEVPFPREGEAARLYAHLNDPPPAPSLYAPSVSMALDDVVVRAMSKSPEDRYPSAGDFGRAAQAALSGASVSVPERTVATGAAATREREAPTAKLAEEPATPSQGNRRLVVGGLLALVAIGVVAALIVSGGGDDGARGETSVPTTSQEAKKEKSKPQPQTLTKAQLIEKGDEICADSQDTFASYRDTFPSGEQEASVPYSRLLVTISSRAVRRFNELDPPPGLEQPYQAYVKAQEEVGEWDMDALQAAEDEDLTAYLSARESRDETQPERERLSDAVGFEVCSQPQ
ncbi:MAG TPA: serine/threonine-protein kinase [Solirubrobacterales bacterium]